jgi:uncharacterized protein
MKTNLKYKPAWMQLLIFGSITCVIGYISTVIGSLLVLRVNHVNLSVFGSFTPEDYAKPEFAGVVRGLLIVQFFGFFLLPSLLFAYLADPEPLQYAGLKKPDRVSYIFLGVVIILCSYLMVEWLTVLNTQAVRMLAWKNLRLWIEKSESDKGATLDNIINMKSSSDLLKTIFLVGVLAAVGEELFFRGILQRILIKVFKKPWLGILVTAAIFSAIHEQFLGFFPRMILGIILGYLYWYSGSLLPAIAGHFVFNSFQLMLLYFKVINPHQQSAVSENYLTITGIIGVLAVIFLFYHLRKNSKTNYSRVYDELQPDPPDKYISRKLF